MPADRLKLLDQILDGFVTVPDPGALVVACDDPEVLYLAQVLTDLDRRSDADRFWIVADPFTGPRAYLDLLAAHLDLAPAAAPEQRLQALLEQLLATLPPGDHRLVLALVPVQIDDPEGYALLTRPLLQPSADPRLRVILRDHAPAPPRPDSPFALAAASPSPQLLAYHFSLPHELIVADVEAAAADPERPPAERAAALLQLASRELGHGHLGDALARCEQVAGMPLDPALQALALALKADILRRADDLEAALATGGDALQQAVAAGALPVVVHAAMALGDLIEQLGAPADAIACLTLAERAAVYAPDQQARLRARIDALKDTSC